MPQTETETEPTADEVVMRFLTQGGATVELHRQNRIVRQLPGWGDGDGEERLSHGFNWLCLGCDAIGGGGRYGMGIRHFDEDTPDESRKEANQHAEICRAMPRPRKDRL